MRCGRISVEGEAEEVAALPRTYRLPRRQQSRNKKDAKVRGSNPYAARGLEKFATLNEELAKKRVYVARKTGAPEDLVRFCYTTKGWVPVVVKGFKSGGGDPRVSILRPSRRYTDGGSQENGNGSLKIEDGCQNHETMSVEPVGPWSGYLRTTAFGALTLSAMMVRKSVVPATAMAVVMVVLALQKRWQGGVMCMKKFVMGGMNYFSDLIVHWKNKLVEKEPEKVEMVEKEPEKVVENRNQNNPEDDVVVSRAPEIKKRRGGTLSLSGSLCKGKIDSENQGGTKSKKEYARIVSMDGQPRKPLRPSYHKSDSLNRSFNTRRLKKGGMGPSVGATVMIIVLICLVFYGRIFAILATSAWWYLMPRSRIEAKKSQNGDLGKMDLKDRELRKKRVIMDGLLDRNHNNKKTMPRS